MTESKEIKFKVERNGIFLKLGICSLACSMASIAAYLINPYPTDTIILACFLPAVVIAQIINLFLPAASVRSLFTMHFATVIIRSLLIIAPIWAIIAFGGSELTKEIRQNFHLFEGEGYEWGGISLVLFSSFLTLLTWHIMYHRHSQRNQPEQ